MYPDTTQTNDFRFDDPRQFEIYKRLDRVGRGPASFYRDAARLMAVKPPFTSTTHLVAHLIREIESALRDILYPVAVRSTTIEPDNSETHRTQIRTILSFFEVAETHPVAQFWLLLPGRENNYGLAARAHRDALANPRRNDESFEAFWNQVEAWLDFLLDQFTSRYLEFHQQLDELLSIKFPTPKDVEQFRNGIPSNPVSESYFFERVSSAWLNVLSEGGLFKEPPNPVGGTVLIWPASRYLLRMSEEKPAEVWEIVANIPETENYHVNQDICDIILKMPIERVMELLPTIRRWVEKPTWVLFSLKLADVIIYIAEAEKETSLELLHTLLTLLPDPNETDNFLLPPEPRGKIGEWEYSEILEKTVPRMVVVGGLDTLNTFCSVLEDAVKLSRKGEEKGDSSHHWRPFIEENSEYYHGIRDDLINVVRDSAIQLIDSHANSLTEVNSILQRQQSMIFHRVALYLLVRYSDADPSLIANSLTNRRYFDLDLREYRLLLTHNFGKLSHTDQATILAWLDGIEPDYYSDKRQWQIYWLTLIESSLPEKWKQTYTQLTKELGKPDLSMYEDRPIVSTYIGPRSPKAVDELASMSIEEIVTLLKGWRPHDEFMSPSPEGLARNLEQVIASSPNDFARGARHFADVPPRYISALLSGIRSAVKERKQFEWHPILELCSQITHMTEPANIDRDSDLENKWSWTRKRIADLLRTGFEVSQIPFEFRDVAWNALLPLTRDPDPSPEDDVRYSVSDRTLIEQSYNTVRGTAINAAFSYFFWVRRNLKSQNDTINFNGFNDTPEVREVLDERIQNDTSPMAWAVFGRYLPWIIGFDKPWVTKNLSRFFPIEPEREVFYNALWETYVVDCPPYNNVFDLLSPQYERAITRIGSRSDNPLPMRDPDQRLAEHLITFYQRGLIDLREPDGMLVQFYSVASDDLCAGAIRSVGVSWINTTEDMSLEVSTRLQNLWMFRMENAKQNPAEHKKELNAFGWWFASGKFPIDWVLDQLKSTLQIASIADPHIYRKPMEMLTKVSEDTPSKSVECLELIITPHMETWSIHMWEKNIRIILSNACQSSDETAKRTASHLINRLFARGHIEFRDLEENCT